MRRRSNAVAIIVASIACLLTLIVPARASCAAAGISVGFPQPGSGGDQTPVERHAVFGGEVIVTGDSWGTACNDTGVGCLHRAPLGAPQKDIAIWISSPPYANRHLIGHVDADDSYRFTLRVPMADGGEPTTVLIEAISSGQRAEIRFPIAEG